MAITLANAYAPLMPAVGRMETHKDAIRWIKDATTVLEDALDRITTDLVGISQGVRPVINNQTGTTYTLVDDDEIAIVLCDNASAITVTVPPGLGPDPAASGAYITHIYQQGAGQVTLSAGSGVTLNNASSLQTRAQYSSLTLVKIGDDEFNVIGDMA